MARLPRSRWLILWASVVTLSGCTDPTAPGAVPGFVGLTQWFANPFLLQAARVVPVDSCPPVVASTLPATRRSIPGSTATIALPSTALTAPFDDERGVVYRIPGEGLLGISYDADVVARLDYNDGRGRPPIIEYPIMNACQVLVNGQPARLFVEFQRRFSENVEILGPVVFTESLLLVTSSPTGRRVNVAMVGAGTTSVATPPPAEGELNFAINRLLSRVATIQW